MFKRLWWMFLVMLPVGAVIGLLVAAVITYVMPKKFESEAVIELREPTAAKEAEEVPTGAESYKFHFGTELEKFRSSKTLGSVVESLDLVQRWNMDKQAAIQILKSIVATQRIDGTDLVSIRVRHINKEDARDIAAEVAQAYKEERVETEKRSQEAVLQVLTKQVRDQEDSVEEGKAVIIAIAKSKGLLVGDKPSAGEAAEQAVKNLPDLLDYADARRDLEVQQKILEALRMKRLNSELKFKLPSESVVVHDKPIIPQVPVSPNVTLNLVMGSVGGLLVSPLMALLVILVLGGLRPTERPRKSEVESDEPVDY
jgi:uncharacterized protein involved in exopolysaccharide biosynthesis